MKNNVLPSLSSSVLLTIQEFKGSDYNHFIGLELEDGDIKRIENLPLVGDEDNLPLEKGTCYATFGGDNIETRYTTDFMFVGFIMANAEAIDPEGTVI